MDILLLIVGILCLLTGLAGAVLPLPGPPLSFAGMIALHYSRFADFTQNALIIFGVITAIVTILDYYVPIWGTRKFGGGKWGVYGSALGLIVGLFFGPLGIFIGPFIGAFAGEYLFDRNPQKALKAAVGSFVGLMAGMVVKVVFCMAMLIYSGIEVFQNL